MVHPMDRELWASACNGDAAAFGEIFARHAKPVYNYLFRRCGDWATAEDLTSIVFLEAWRKRAVVQLVNDSALPFLLGVATNVLRNRRRSERRFRAALARLPAEVESAQGEADPAERLTAEQDMRAILAVFSRLPRREQDVVSLCLWTGLTYEEAAVALGIPVGTVRSRLSRARSRLRELLVDSGHEGVSRITPHPEQEGVS